MSPRDSGDGGSGVGGRSRDSGGETNSKAGEERRKTAATATTVARKSGRKWVTEDPLVRNSNDGARGEYRVDEKGQEKSADKRSKWSGD